MTSSSPEVVGEGSYGCVHKPSLICADKNISYKNKISKVMLSREATKELKEYAVISRIDKKNEYYTGMPTSCRVKPTVKTLKAVSKCKNLKRKYLKKNMTAKNALSKMSLLVMNDGGKDLKSMAAYFKQCPNTPETVNQIKTFWVEAHRLFRGLLTFQKFDIAHHDIKPQNLVYNMDTHRINYIDFGHMRNMSAEIQKSGQSDNWIYDYAFWNYPFEIQFLNKDVYTDFVNQPMKEREKFVVDFITDLKKYRDTKFTNAFRIFMDYMLRNRTAADKKMVYDRYIMGFKKTVMDHMNSYDAFVKKSVETIDVYGLGMSMQYMLAYTKRFMNKSFVKELDECFFRMTTSDLMNRYSIADAISEFEICLESAGYATFKNNQFVEDPGVSQTFSKRCMKKGRNQKSKVCWNPPILN